MSGTEYKGYLRGWRERWALDRERDVLAARKARALAERLARLLVERHAARRVFLVGSLARGEFRHGSDIDLLVEGIADSRFFRADAEVAREAGGVDVDLVPIESATPDYLRLALPEAVVLRDARDP